MNEYALVDTLTEIATDPLQPVVGVFFKGGEDNYDVSVLPFNVEGDVADEDLKTFHAFIKALLFAKEESRVDVTKSEVSIIVIEENILNAEKIAGAIADKIEPEVAAIATVVGTDRVFWKNPRTGVQDTVSRKPE